VTGLGQRVRDGIVFAPTREKSEVLPLPVDQFFTEPATFSMGTVRSTTVADKADSIISILSAQ